MMFGFSIIRTKKLDHLYTEVSKLAIENVELNKRATRLECQLARAWAECAEIDNQLFKERSLTKYLKRVVGLNAPKKKKKRK